MRLPGQSNTFDDLVKQGWVGSGCYSFFWIFYLQTSRKIAGKLRAHSVEVVTVYLYSLHGLVLLFLELTLKVELKF